MLKSQDIVLLLKLISKKGNLELSQNKLANQLCISVSEVNASFKRLLASGLVQPGYEKHKVQPVMPAIEEFLISGFKYVFPIRQGAYTRGVPTSFASPVLNKHIQNGNDPIPVWPCESGDAKGVAISPLYPSVPKALSTYPDSRLYEFLSLLDAIRHGRARERAIASKMLKERIHDSA